MQTIDNSLFQVSVDENGARMAHLVSLTDQFDYLGEQESEEGMALAFPVMDQADNLANKLPWTVVDKGDTRVSLTLIDTPESYKSFPYHFEVMTTYALEGNQVNISFYLKILQIRNCHFLWALSYQLLGKVKARSIRLV